MTNEKAIRWLDAIKKYYIYGGDEAYDKKRMKAIDKAIQALEAQPTHGSTYGGVSWGGTYKEEAQPNSNEFFNFDAPMVKNSEAVSRSVLTEYINTKLTSNEEMASDATNEGRWVEEKTYLYGVEILEDLDEYVKTMPPVTPTSENIKEAYLKGYDYGVKDWFRSKTQPCEDCISREAVIRLVEQYPNIIGNRCNGLIADIKHLPSVTPERPKGKWIKCKSRFGTEYFKCSECGRKLNWIDRDDNYCNSCGSDNSESTKEWFKERDTKLAEMSGGGEE